MKKTEIPLFATKKELFKFLKDNLDILTVEKKSAVKYADGISFNQVLYDSKGDVIKANTPVESLNLTEIKVKVAINSTNLLDSHKDVHIPGLWKKSLKENKLMMHLQEHMMQFDHIISDGADLKAYTQNLTWKELGFKFDGESEVLTFESIIRKSRNPFMFDQYAKGYVKNHSVGMQYVSMVMCIDDDSEYYGAEFEAWNKYYEYIANKDAADEAGYFWAIKEAKAIEGSAVPRGSNYATPTLDNNMKNEPDLIHSKTPPENSTGVNYGRLSEFIFN